MITIHFITENVRIQWGLEYRTQWNFEQGYACDINTQVKCREEGDIDDTF